MGYNPELWLSNQGMFPRTYGAINLKGDSRLQQRMLKLDAAKLNDEL